MAAARAGALVIRLRKIDVLLRWIALCRVFCWETPGHLVSVCHHAEVNYDAQTKRDLPQSLKYALYVTTFAISCPKSNQHMCVRSCIVQF